MAGAPFFFAVADGEGVAVGVGLSAGVSLGLGEGEGVSVGDGEGEAFFFFFPGEALGEGDGVEVGEAFFFLVGEADGFSSDLSAGFGESASFFFFAEVGVGDFSGVVVAFGDGDFSAIDVFFVVPELLRFRGAGVGVGAKIFFSLVPRDSSAAARTGKLVTIVRPARVANPMANARRLAVIPNAVEAVTQPAQRARPGFPPRSASSDILRGPSTSLRSARDDTRFEV